MSRVSPNGSLRSGYEGTEPEPWRQPVPFQIISRFRLALATPSFTGPCFRLTRPVLRTRADALTASYPDPMPWERDPYWVDLMDAIGTLVVQGAHLEHEVRFLVLNMLGGPHWRRTELVIDGFGAQQMIQRCARLAHVVLGDSLQEDVVKWLRRVEEVQGVRNDIVHSSWTTGPTPTATATRATKKQGIQRVRTQYTPEQIRTAAGECAKVWLEGLDLTVEIQQFSLDEAQDPSGDTSPWRRTTDMKADP